MKKRCPHCGESFNPIATHRPNRSAPGGSSHPAWFGALSALLALATLVAMTWLLTRGVGVSWFDPGARWVLIGAGVGWVATLASLLALLVAWGDWYVAMCPSCFRGVSLTFRDLNP